MAIDAQTTQALLLDHVQEVKDAASAILLLRHHLSQWCVKVNAHAVDAWEILGLHLAFAVLDKHAVRVAEVDAAYLKISRLHVRTPRQQIRAT